MVLGGAKRHASLHSLKPGSEEELRLCSMCLTYENDLDVNKQFGKQFIL